MRTQLRRNVGNELGEEGKERHDSLVGTMILGQLEESVEVQRYVMSCVDHLDACGGRGPALLRLFAPIDVADEDDGAIAAVAHAAANRFCESLSQRRGDERFRDAGSIARAEAWCSTPRQSEEVAPSSDGARISIVSEILAVEVQCGVRHLDDLERNRVIALTLTRILLHLVPIVPSAACPTLRACGTLDFCHAIEAMRSFFAMPTGFFPQCHRKLLQQLLPLFARAAEGGDLDSVAKHLLPLLMRPERRQYLSEQRQRAQLLSTTRVLIQGAARMKDAIAGTELLALRANQYNSPASPARKPPTFESLLARKVFDVRDTLSTPHI